MHCSALFSLLLLSASFIVPTLSTPFKGRDLDRRRTPLPLPVRILHQFSVGTWMENLAIRPNGKILATALSSPELVQVDNLGIEPVKVVHTFANAASCSGITELGQDVFYVVAGTFNISTLIPVPGSWSVYRVDANPEPAEVSLVASFPSSILLNGITVLNKDKKWLLISDSVAGVVYRLEADTGKVVKVLEDPLMKSDSSSSLGINGIKIKANNLYFTNTNKNILARVLIKDDGTSTESATAVANIDFPDDFIFNGAQDVVVAQNGVDRLGLVSGETVETLAGGPSNGTESKLFGPTAVQFGSKADSTKAYITTNGGIAQYEAGNVTRGGTIFVVDVQGYL